MLHTRCLRCGASLLILCNHLDKGSHKVNYLSLIGCPLKGAWIGYEVNTLISVLFFNLVNDKYSYSDKS